MKTSVKIRPEYLSQTYQSVSRPTDGGTPQVSSLLLIGAIKNGSGKLLQRDSGYSPDLEYIAALSEGLQNLGIAYLHPVQTSLMNAHTNRKQDFLQHPEEADAILFSFLAYNPAYADGDFTCSLSGQSKLAANPSNWTKAINASQAKVVANVYAFDGISDPRPFREPPICDFIDQSRYMAVSGIHIDQPVVIAGEIQNRSALFFGKRMDIFLRHDVAHALGLMVAPWPKTVHPAPKM